MAPDEEKVWVIKEIVSKALSLYVSASMNTASQDISIDTLPHETEPIITTIDK